jgi:hypothetical protein
MRVFRFGVISACHNFLNLRYCAEGYSCVNGYQNPRNFGGAFFSGTKIAVGCPLKTAPKLGQGQAAALCSLAKRTLDGSVGAIRCSMVVSAAFLRLQPASKRATLAESGFLFSFTDILVRIERSA